MDVASVDVIWNGFHQAKKIADLAETFEVNCAPHNYYSHLATFIAAQWCAAIPNARILEYDVDDVPWRDELVTALPEISAGELRIPGGPGWGVDLNEDVLRAHPWPTSQARPLPARASRRILLVRPVVRHSAHLQAHDHDQRRGRDHVRRDAGRSTRPRCRRRRRSRRRSTDAQTDVAPLMPQRNAVGAPGRVDAARMPIGNAMPMSSPHGTRIATAVAMRAGVVAPSIRSMISGVSSPKAATVTTRAPSGTSVSAGRRGSSTRSLSMLPIPLETSSEKSTTVSA